MHEPIPPTLNEHGDETHPAWGMMGVSRVSSSPPGATLFDSDIQHQHSITLRLTRAKRKRTLKRDWLHGGKELMEVQMSESQWASLVSSVGVGSGVPVTIRHIDGDRDVPGVVYEPRLRVSMDETHNAAREAFADVKKAFEAYEQKKNAANLRDLKYAIQNAPANVSFAAKSLTEHAENVTQRMRSDIEAMVIDKADQLGIEPSEVLDTNLLEEGS